MFTRQLLGIVFTPSWLRVAHAQLSRGHRPKVSVFGIPLPMGCINEGSGAIEDSDMLSAAMRSIPCLERRNLEQEGVFLVVPQLLCYRTAFTAPPEHRTTPLRRLLTEHSVDLPGERGSLIVDGYARASQVDDSRAVMVLAARRSALEAYARLFRECLWCIGGITTGEIARYNRWKLQSSDIESQVVLVCGSDIDSRELSVWDRGVLTASDTQFCRQRTRMSTSGYGGGGEFIGEHDELLGRDILALAERQREIGRPIERVLFGGMLRERTDLHERIAFASGVRCEASRNPSGFEVVFPSDVRGVGVANMAASDSGLFDDAIGALAPEIVREMPRVGRRTDDFYQPHA